MSLFINNAPRSRQVPSVITAYQKGENFNSTRLKGPCINISIKSLFPYVLYSTHLVNKRPNTHIAILLILVFLPHQTVCTEQYLFRHKWATSWRKGSWLGKTRIRWRWFIKKYCGFSYRSLLCSAAHSSGGWIIYISFYFSPVDKYQTVLMVLKW